jgi:UDP-glucose:(heptosyl)LPS alpha-1,3-glucosyltransferase
VLYNGVDHERFHPENRGRWREKVRRQWNIPAQAPVVLFAGNGFRRKGLDRLVRAWRSQRLKEIYLLVVGMDAQLARYRSWAGREAQGRIVFAGLQENIEAYYAAADLLALPSFQEAFGNVVLEALASGVPVLVSKEVGAAEVLTGALTGGVMRNPDDPAEIESRILALMDRERQPVLARDARALGERYSWHNHFRALEKQIYRVAARSP